MIIPFHGFQRISSYVFSFINQSIWVFIQSSVKLCYDKTDEGRFQSFSLKSDSIYFQSVKQMFLFRFMYFVHFIPFMFCSFLLIFVYVKFQICQRLIHWVYANPWSECKWFRWFNKRFEPPQRQGSVSKSENTFLIDSTHPFKHVTLQRTRHYKIYILKWADAQTNCNVIWKPSDSVVISPESRRAGGVAPCVTWGSANAASKLLFTFYSEIEWEV